MRHLSAALSVLVALWTLRIFQAPLLSAHAAEGWDTENRGPSLHLWPFSKGLSQLMFFIKKMRFPIPNTSCWVAEVPSQCMQPGVCLWPTSREVSTWICVPMMPSMCMFSLEIHWHSHWFYGFPVSCQEACRYTWAISGDHTLLAFKIAFLCINCENLPQDFSSSQACKQHVSCWVVSVIYRQVKGRCFLEPFMFEQSISAPGEDETLVPD